MSLSLMVLATPVPKRNAAMKLNAAAQKTAWSGVRTRGVTTVATELAASWNPLNTSKMNARPIKKNTIWSGEIIVCPKSGLCEVLGVLEHYAGESLGDIDELAESFVE